MQRKTVERTIRAKIDEWIESINNTQLRHDLKNNVLVSGGSIVSLFTGQQVNDFDVYIKDINVLKELTLYYVKGFDELRILDGRSKESIVKEYKGGLSEEQFLDSQSFVASSVRNLQPNQIKILCMDGNGGLRVERGQEDNPSKYRPVFFSPNAISLSDDIQVVIRFHGDSKDIHKTFDFVHATNYWTHSEGLVTNVAALESILSKTLYYQGSLYPLTSVIRSKKFINRGWKISAGEMFKMMYQLSMLDLQNIDVLEEQLIGVDVAYFEMLIKALREQDEREEGFKPTPEYMNTIVDRIFGGL